MREGGRSVALMGGVRGTKGEWVHKMGRRTWVLTTRIELC